MRPKIYNWSGNVRVSKIRRIGSWTGLTAHGGF